MSILSAGNVERSPDGYRVVPISRLRELLNYDPATGVFTWRVSRNHNAREGQPAGTRSVKGYVILTVDGIDLRAHRAALAIVNGEWPEGRVDHMNGQTSDNRACNLREVSQQENMQNIRRAQRNNRSGFRGVSAHRGKWVARIKPPMRPVVRVGGFETPELAHEFYMLAKQLLHPGYISA